MSARKADPTKSDDARASAATRPHATARRLARLRPLAHLRRRFGWTLALLPVLSIVLVDVLTRGSRIAGLPLKYMGSYSMAVVESALLWGSLMCVCGARKGVYRWLASLLFIAFFTAAVGGQLYFHSQYSTYMNLDATLFGTSFTGSVFGQVAADGKNFLRNVVPILLLALAFVLGARKFLRPKRSTLFVARSFAPIAVIA